MKLFNTKYNQAELWMNMQFTRESKKQVIQPDTELYEEIARNVSGYKLHSQTVFSRSDLGHNPDEAQKIKQIYDELGDIPLAPVFA